MSYITTDPKEHLKVSETIVMCGQQVSLVQRDVLKLNFRVQALNGFLKQSDGRDKLTAALQVGHLRSCRKLTAS